MSRIQSYEFRKKVTDLSSRAKRGTAHQTLGSLPSYPCYPRNPRLMKLARDKLLQLHDIRGKLANAFGCLLRRHRILIQEPAELLLVELELVDLSGLCFFRSKLA